MTINAMPSGSVKMVPVKTPVEHTNVSEAKARK